MFFRRYSFALEEHVGADVFDGLRYPALSVTKRSILPNKADSFLDVLDHKLEDQVLQLCAYWPWDVHGEGNVVRFDQTQGDLRARVHERMDVAGRQLVQNDAQVPL